MQTQPAGRIAGIDFGTVRIGVAVSNPSQTLASPYETYTRRDKQADARWFLSFAETEQVRQFVVGLPVHLDGNESRKSLEAREFGRWLGEVTGLPVDFFDERFTTAEAEQLLGQAELTKKQRKARLDRLAAQIMLTAYLESARRGEARPEPLDG